LRNSARRWTETILHDEYTSDRQYQDPPAALFMFSESLQNRAKCSDHERDLQSYGDSIGGIHQLESRRIAAWPINLPSMPSAKASRKSFRVRLICSVPLTYSPKALGMRSMVGKRYIPAKHGGALRGGSAFGFGLNDQRDRFDSRALPCCEDRFTVDVNVFTWPTMFSAAKPRLKLKRA
jgi:hypothetical protein